MKRSAVVLHKERAFARLQPFSKGIPAPSAEKSIDSQEVSTRRLQRIVERRGKRLCPAEVESREIPGHWEGDLLIGKYHASAIGTLVERTSRKVLICRLEGRTSDDVIRAFEKRIMDMPPLLRQTLTYDRGKEMTEHEKLAKRTQLEIFFCDPQSPWQRGTNENTNSLVRDFFPEGTDFSLVSEAELLDVERKLNERPRKCLEYKTPDEVFFSYVPVALGS